MKYAVCPNRKKSYQCDHIYTAGRDVWHPRKRCIVNVPKNNFKKCLNCGEVLIKALSSCGCVNEHSEACKSYRGPD